MKEELVAARKSCVYLLSSLPWNVLITSCQTVPL